VTDGLYALTSALLVAQHRSGAQKRREPAEFLQRQSNLAKAVRLDALQARVNERSDDVVATMLAGVGEGRHAAEGANK